MPFLRLTRDRRGFENTFLLHADHPGAKARLLYWYRTAPGIGLGRPALDEDAIRTIEENHPDIEFDWPAILALSEVMTPEEEPASAPKEKKPRGLRRGDRAKQSRSAVDQSTEPTEDSIAPLEPAEPSSEPNPLEPLEPLEPMAPMESASAREISGELRRDRAGAASGREGGPPRSGLVDDLAGREVARALRARYSEIKSKIDRIDGDRGPWLARAEAINPDAWQTPEAVLQGVSNAGAAYEKLKTELA